jgi:hypothetical protein
VLRISKIMNLVRVEAVSWNRLLTRNFAVVPELLGRSHTFPFDQRTITIELPTIDELSQDPTREGRVDILSYREEASSTVPICLSVNSVDVLVQLPKQVHVPEQILHQPPNAYDVLSQDQQSHLEKLAETHGSIAEKAFDVWVRTLRWKSNNGSIGRPEVLGPRSGWTTYLLDETTRHRFWAATQIFKARSRMAVTLAEWNEAERVLGNGIRSPVFYDLMFDAMEHFRLGDLQRSVVDVAVACESFMRVKVKPYLPDVTDETNIRQVLNHFFPKTLSTDETRLLESIRYILHQLFTARNSILHSGNKADLTSSECQKYLEATEKLISIG